MTKKEREIIKTIGLKVEHIVKWDNKNLKQKQYYELDESLNMLKGLLGKKYFESI